MKTNKLIQYNIFKNAYKVNSPRLALFMQKANTELGIKNYKLYYLAYVEYKKFPWLYDMKGGDIVLATKVFFKGLKYSSIDIDNLFFYRLIRGLCFNDYSDENLDMWITRKWIHYPLLIEEAYVKAYTKIIGMGYVNPNCIFSNLDEGPLQAILKDFIRFFYFATWKIIHQDDGTIGWWVHTVNTMFFHEVLPDYFTQAKNILNRYLQEIADTEEYKFTTVHYY